ncbi:transcriptional regulator, partial [Pseudomonas putida]
KKQLAQLESLKKNDEQLKARKIEFEKKSFEICLPKYQMGLRQSDQYLRSSKPNTAGVATPVKGREEKARVVKNATKKNPHSGEVKSRPKRWQNHKGSEKRGKNAKYGADVVESWLA